VNSNSRWVVMLPVLAALVLVLFWLQPFTSGSNSLVVYCAHDSVYADQILKDFERQTGIHVDIRYDTEATKSLGLINLIVQEQRQPRCDVFWNNEMLGTLDLQAQGLLEPYQGSGWTRLPEKYRDPEGHWVGFGARMRVVIVNTGQVSSDNETIQNVVTMETSKAAVAKPLFGTTLTHYTVLWNLWGPERLKDWHHELRMRGVREMSGNGSVKDVVANGVCSVGLTDTDDAFVAIDDKLPVEMVPVRIATASRPEDAVSALDAIAGEPAENRTNVMFTEPTGGTICIPNTAAIIRGTKRQEAARKLIDFLASAETELALAKSKSRQVPLGPVDETQLPADVRGMRPWAEDGFDLRPLLPARRECLDWLKSEYIK
jgi:iron(III) transport system substrate-binding protein